MAQEQTVYPLLCKPVLKSKIWGGRKFESLFGMDLPDNEKIGEAWMVADLPEGSSSVANGSRKGDLLADVTKDWGEKLIGPAWKGKPTGGRFPLLVKFLDAQDNLSVQVHPDEKACETEFPDDYSKDESWIILWADEEGCILHGFEDGATLEDFDRLLEQDQVTDIIRSCNVSAGDFFRVAPGTVHALCKGVVILEIQEPSDSTFRIYDYGRKGDDGQPRELHLDAARKVMRFGEDQEDQPEIRKEDTEWGHREILVDVPAYRIERLEVRKPVAWKVNPKSAQVLALTDGEAVLLSGGQQLSLKKGDCVILPAAVGNAALQSNNGSCQVILSGAGGINLLT